MRVAARPASDRDPRRTRGSASQAAHRQEAQDSLQGECDHHQRRSASPVRDPKPRTTGTSVEPDCGEGNRDQCEGDTQRPLPRGHPPARPRCRRDQRQCEAARDGRPGLGLPTGSPRAPRDGEARLSPRSRDPHRNSRVGASTENHAGEDGDDRGRRMIPVSRASRMRELVVVRGPVGRKSASSAEEADEQLADSPPGRRPLTPQSPLSAAGRLPISVRMTPSILLVDTIR